MTSRSIQDEAIGWLVSQQSDDMDWDGFTAWLEEDPRHRAAFDQVALLDADLDRHASALATQLSGVEEAPDAPSRWRQRAGFGGGMIAAGLALLLVTQNFGSADIAQRSYQTAAGQTREVTFAGDIRATLAPESKLVARGSDVTLAGIAYFDVPHRTGRTLSIHAGALEVTDIGTRFSVVNSDGVVRVEVADGSVQIRSARLAKPLSLSRGHALLADSSTDTIRLFAIAPSEVGSWRSGRIRFDGESLRLVARQISRYSGTKVSVDPTIADRPFSGVISIEDGVPPAQTLADILDLDSRIVDGGVRIQPRTH